MLWPASLVKGLLLESLLEILMPKYILIAAIDRNNAIGKDNTLPWKLPSDMARFKELTMGKTILMGRKTYQSIGRALPGRKNIVLTRTKWEAPADVQVFPSLEALEAELPDEEIWVIGGGEVYKQTITKASSLVITHVDLEVEADSWFPDIDPEYSLYPEHFGPKREQNGIQFRFCTYAPIQRAPY